MQNMTRIVAIAFLLVSVPAFAAPQGGGKGKEAAKKAGAPAATPPPAAQPAGPSPDQERLNEAVKLFREEQYGAASVALYDIAASGSSAKESAQYNLAKALYRLKLHHSALYFFTQLLAAGPESKYYRSALEWCLFIARKITASDRVLDAVAKYSDGRFPEDYKDEFRYLLARHHYLKALAIETGAELGPLGEAKAEETITGGKSFSGDVFSGDEGGEEETVIKKSGSGVSIDEDIFGDEPKKDDKKKGDEKKAAPAPKKEEKKPEIAQEPPRKPGDELSAKEHLDAAQRLLIQVDTKSAFGPRAKFLEGVMLFREKRENDALEAFKAVIRMTKDPKNAEERNLRQLAFFQLARTHFGAKQPSFSIYYYDKIRRFTYEWLEAIYESSWAEFRLGNYEKSLGNLLTLHSPFFSDQYFPESHILKAVVYYENCRYPEAKKILEEFKARYEPVHEELKSMTARTQAHEKYHEALLNLTNQELAEASADKSRIMAQILELALSDAELATLDASYREVDDEIRSMDGVGPVFSTGKLRPELEAILTTVRGDLQREAGRAVKRKLEFERDQIKSLIQQAVRIDIETAHAEQERIESTLRDVQSEPGRKDKEFIEWTDDEKLVWPFNDEYWKDELGTYQLTLAHSCR
jgi:hypothetical protein